MPLALKPLQNLFPPSPPGSFLTNFPTEWCPLILQPKGGETQEENQHFPKPCENQEHKEPHEL